MDSLPPVLINASPKMKTTFFDNEKFVLTFNEFVKLNDISKQLIISPPMEAGSYTVYPQTGVSKKISLVFNDSLQEETTYTFNFGESIQDHNEGNILSFFSYTLSTGATIDSLRFSGRVTDAFEAETPPYIALQLYPIDSSYNDSTIYTQKPLYVASTLDSTIFEFQNLKAGKYELIAILDNASNYFFDQNIDKIGFLERQIELPGDSLVELRIFKEITNFAWDKPFFVNDHHITLPYFGRYDNQTIEMISEVTSDFESLITKNRKTDSLNYWFKKGPKDSIQFRYPYEDSIRTHIVKFREPLPDSLVIKKISPRVWHLKDSVILESNLPLISVDSSKIRVRNKDSIFLPINTYLHSNKDQVRITMPNIEPNDAYNFELLPNAFTDFFGATNDTISFNVITQKFESYGTLIVQFKNLNDSPLIVDLLNSRYKLKRRITDIQNSTYTFDFLPPGKYNLRVIKDTNNNYQWDTGNYLQKIQPEEVIYLPEEIDVRANWDVNQVFDPIQIRLDQLKSSTASEVTSLDPDPKQ